MPRFIEAIYEDGVFKPLEKTHFKEHEKVEMKIFSTGEWHEKFNKLIEKIQKKATRYPAREIENDIAQAIKETREGRHGC